MKSIELPEELKGPWEHALILSYGIDVPFFEGTLWSQFRSSCRNRVILADGRRYLDACESCARTGLARYLNQRYLAEGIYAPRSAHAKVILLSNSERGRLLVGSGNLNMDGFASGGEIFTKYEYGPDSSGYLNAFLATRELVQGIVRRGYVSSLARERIDRIWAECPWFLQAASSDWLPVRHNLVTSFLDQLGEAVAGEQVDELWILSPFYDRKLVALDRLLNTLAPRQATILVQPGLTSMDRSALQSLVDGRDGRLRVMSFSKSDDLPYVHAKLYLAKLRDRAVCVQGSANLSQVAMLLAVPQGNIELCNLLVGERDSFDYLLQELRTEPVSDLANLDVSIQATDEPKPVGGWQLTSGEWRNNSLSLGVCGSVPDLTGASLMIGEFEFPLEISWTEMHSLGLTISAEVSALLRRPVPVKIRWNSDGALLTTNPVFPGNRAALESEGPADDSDDRLGDVGDLDLDDEDMEQLLGELEAALPVDRRSVWQLAGRTPPPGAEDDDEALRLEYADVDYEMLRQHPKMIQYRPDQPRGVYRRTRLQIILSSITDHFRGLLEPPDEESQSQSMIDALRIEDGHAETEEEREEEEEQKQTRKKSHSKRVAQLLRNFIRRYLKGLQSPDFLEFAGYEVVSNNYVIFTHLLYRLFIKEWVDAGFLVKSLVEIWSFFWGHGDKQGYYWLFDKEQQAEMGQWSRKIRWDAVLLATLFHCGQLGKDEVTNDSRFLLRDFARRLLIQPPFELDAVLLEETWRIVAALCPYEPPRPPEITGGFRKLADFETEISFLAALEIRHRLPRGSCRFDRVSVHRESLDPDRTWNVKCLLLEAEGVLRECSTAIAVLQDWMRFEQIDYYRIQTQPPGCLAFFEGVEKKGLYWDSDTKTAVSIGLIEPSSASWDRPLDMLQRLAAELDARLTMPVIKDEMPAQVQKDTR